MHRVSATASLKEKEKKFSHAKRAEAAWYSVYARRQEWSILFSSLNTNRARVTQLLWTSSSFDIRRSTRTRGR